MRKPGDPGHNWRKSMKPQITAVRDARGAIHAIEFRPGRAINIGTLDGPGTMPGLPRLFLPDGREIRNVDGRFRTNNGEWFDAV